VVLREDDHRNLFEEYVSPLTACMICFEAPENENYLWNCCHGHSICRECMFQYVKLECNKLMHTTPIVATISCPIRHCSAVLTKRHQIYLDVAKYILDNLIINKISQGEVVPLRCPNCLCCICPERDVTRGVQKMIQCPICVITYCTGCRRTVKNNYDTNHRDCHRWFHEKLEPERKGSDYPKVDLFFAKFVESSHDERVDLLSSAMHEVMFDTGFRQCPVCPNMKIFRLQDCSHITDSICGTDICYVCSRQLFYSKKFYLARYQHFPDRVAFVNSKILNQDEDVLYEDDHNPHRMYFDDKEKVRTFFKKLARKERELECPYNITNMMCIYRKAKWMSDEDATFYFHNILFYERFMFVVDEKFRTMLTECSDPRHEHAAGRQDPRPVVDRRTFGPEQMRMKFADPAFYYREALEKISITPREDMECGQYLANFLRHGLELVCETIKEIK
jgi:hypothetical protein